MSGNDALAAAIGAGAALIAGPGWQVPAPVLVWLGWANLLLGVFNLLPAAPLDGGRLVQTVMWWRTRDRKRAERTAGRSGQILGILLIVPGWSRSWAVLGADCGRPSSPSSS